ncbi:MAG: VWA domain-containing protein [Deltaproteobacteria bacterium]|nr:VWA domain-containing protein [Deltaproteobacteria bacterium]
MSRAALAVLFLASPLILTCGGLSARPTPRDPGVLTLQGALGNRWVRAVQQDHAIARVRVGTRPPVAGRRPPINLALVVDTSGSMEGGPIADARTASLALLETLAEGDRLAVVVFHSRTEVLLPSTELDEDNLAEVETKLRRMQARGTTDMAGGLSAGVEEVVRHLVPDGLNRVVLLGDGVPNDPAPIRAMAQAAGERGVSITALGLGPDYNETLMASIAQLSGGRFHFVRESAQMASVFRNEVLRLKRVYARNAVVKLTPGPGVRIESVVGQNVSQAGGQVAVSIGDISQGEARDLIVRLATDGHRDGSSVELMDAIMEFDDALVGAGRLERRVYFGARATADEARITSGRNLEVERAAERMQAAAVTIEAIAMARDGEIDRAREVLARAATEAQQRAQATGSADYDAQAEGYRSLSGALPSVAPAEPSPAPAARQAAPPPLADAIEVRRAHDEAMTELSTH